MIEFIKNTIKHDALYYDINKERISKLKIEFLELENKKKRSLTKIITSEKFLNELEQEKAEIDMMKNSVAAAYINGNVTTDELLCKRFNRDEIKNLVIEYKNNIAKYIPKEYIYIKTSIKK